MGKIHNSVLTKLVLLVALAEFFIMLAYEYVKPLHALIEKYPFWGPILDTSMSTLLSILIYVRSLKKPLDGIIKVTVAMGKGDLSQRANAKIKGEFGTLALAFNEMAEGLKRSRDELSASKDYTDSILASMIDTLIVVDPQAKIKTVNQATCDLLGYKEEEIVGKDVSLMFTPLETDVSPEKTERFLTGQAEEGVFKGARFQKLLKEGSIKNYALTYKTKSGEAISVSFSGSVMRDKEDKLVGIVGVARDMRQMNKLIQDLGDSKAKLQERLDDLERFRKATVDREFRMEELSKKIEELEGKLGKS